MIIMIRLIRLLILNIIFRTHVNIKKTHKLNNIAFDFNLTAHNYYVHDGRGILSCGTLKRELIKTK